MKHQPASTPSGLRFAPIPLASGDAVGCDESTTPITGVTVSVHLADGSDRSVALEYRYGGWWVPAEADQM